MSVTNTSYSTNSYKITIANEFAGSNDIITGVNTAITSLGWSLFDSINQTDYSPMATRVYRAGNVDGTTFKYAILRWDTLNLRLNLSCSESWNTTSKTATNESWHSTGLFAHGYDVRDCYIFVAGTSRHLVLQSYIRNEPSHWAGIFEVERTAVEDISSNSAPCFFYTNSLMFGTPWGTNDSNTRSVCMVAFPRTNDNETGAFAAKTYAPVTTRGMYPPYYPSSNTGNTGANSVNILSTHDGNMLHLGSFYNTIGTWGWDPLKIVVSPVSLDHTYKSMPFGRIYNTAITKPIGSGGLDSTYINADGTGGWPSPTGSNTEFLTLALNGGSEDQFSNTAGRCTLTFANNQGTTVIFGTVTAVGNTVWAAANNGIYSWDMGSGANTSATQRYVNSNGVIDIMFDGLRSIWGTTNNGIIQVDTETYATNANIAADLGCGNLSMDNKYIYASNRTTSTTPKMYRFWRANGNLSSHMLANTALAAASAFGKPVPDYKGFVYAIIQQGSQSTGSGRIRQTVWYAESANANTGLASNDLSASGTINSQAAFYYDPNTEGLYTFLNIATTNGLIYRYGNVANIGSFSTAQLWTPGFSAFSSYRSEVVQANRGYTTWDWLGDLVFMPRRGLLCVSPRRTAAPQSAQTAWISVLTLESTQAGNTNYSQFTGYPTQIGQHVTNDNLTSFNGFPCHQWTNGVRIFQSGRTATSSRMMSIGNLYPNTALNLYSTGRLLVKA